MRWASPFPRRPRAAPDESRPEGVTKQRSELRGRYFDKAPVADEAALDAWSPLEVLRLVLVIVGAAPGAVALDQAIAAECDLDTRREFRISELGEVAWSVPGFAGEAPLVTYFATSLMAFPTEVTGRTLTWGESGTYWSHSSRSSTTSGRRP